MEDVAELAEAVRVHEATSAEVKTLCKDLQVLGRSEFKLLLKWRLLVKKDLQRAAAAAAKAAAAEAGEASGGEEEAAGLGEEGEDEDPEERLLREMGEIKDRWVKVRRAGCAVAVRWVACAWHELPCCDKLVARALMDAHCSLYSALTWHGLHSAN